MSLFITILTWIMSATSILTLWLMGSKTIWGPIVGLLSQVLWFVFIGLTKQWGLLPGAILYTVVQTRNLYKWSKHETKNV